MDTKKYGIGANLLSIMFQIVIADDEDTCIKRTPLCPFPTSWGNRSQELNCVQGTFYVCLQNKDKELVEGCFPKYRIRKEGCPFVRDCDPVSRYPVLAANHHPCPSSLIGCPKGGVYYINQIKKYRNCISGPRLQVRNMPDSTFERTSNSQFISQQPNSSITKNIVSISNSSNSSYVTAGILVTITVVALAVLLCVLYIQRRREVNAEPERNTQKEVSEQRTGKKETIDEESLKGEEMSLLDNQDSHPFVEGNVETSLHQETESLSSETSYTSDFSDLGESSPEKQGLGKDDRNESRISVNHCSDEDCVKTNITAYCATCNENNIFCKTCGKKHSNSNENHDVLSLTNRKRYCRFHDKCPIRLFCSKCQEYVCDSCFLLNKDEGGHGGHPLQKLSVRIDDMKDILKSTLDDLVISTDKIQIDLKGLKEHKKNLIENQTINKEKRQKEIESIENELMRQRKELRDQVRYKRGITHGDIGILELLLENRDVQLSKKKSK